MRKIGFFIRNVYRILIVKPDGDRMMLNCSDSAGDADNVVSETMLKQIIIRDELNIEPNPELQKMLEQRVTRKGPSSSIVQNSVLDIFLSVFSLKNIELKMALVTLALLLAVGIGPVNNHSVNRNLDHFFLADTLGDSSVLNLPTINDSALKLQYK